MSESEVEDDYLSVREQQRLICTCGHRLAKHTEYGCIPCGTSDRGTAPHIFTRTLVPVRLCPKSGLPVTSCQEHLQCP